VHDLNNIINLYPEDDNVYNLSGMHMVQSYICPQIVL